MPDKDLSKVYSIELSNEQGEKVIHPCVIISYNETSKLYTISIGGTGYTLAVPSEKLSEI